MTLRAGAQDQLLTVEKLYFGASYEEALAELDRLEELVSVLTPKASEYRILCLLGLGRMEDAELELEKLVRSNPRYRPDPQRSSPRLLKQFEIVRRRWLSETIRATYSDAKTAFAAQNYADAVARFEALFELLRNVDQVDQEEFKDVRAFASDFLTLAKLASEDDAPVGTTGQDDPHAVAEAPIAGTQQAATSDARQATVYDTSSADVMPPTALGPMLPPPSPHVTAPQKPGIFEILISESGSVESASVRHSISSHYDALVISESRKWRFTPATRNGQPVKFRKVIEIYAVVLPAPPR